MPSSVDDACGTTRIAAAKAKSKIAPKPIVSASARKRSSSIPPYTPALMLRGLLTLATVVVATLVLGLVGIVGGLAAPRSNFGYRIGRLWSRVCLAAAGIEPTFTGLEHAAGTAPRLFLANHLSVVDIWVLAVCLPATTRFVAKRSLFFVPTLGQTMWVAGFIPIDRGDRTQAIRSLGRAASRIRRGASVILFPE